ncbi:MAG: hypothetical protein LBU67_03605 [Oscillospiraceae bacterium]|jgi:hypothetical protein|nr:hypothetical protein [Oscillospiraceae bacterium]
MGKFTVEQIDYLREKANVSYEEAMEVLERYDGDLARCLVDLERRGLLRPQGRRGPGPEGRGHFNLHDGRGHFNPFWGATQGCHRQYHQEDYGSENDRDRPKAFVLDMGGLKDALFSHVVVRKAEKVVADLPLIYLIAAACLGPHLVFLSVLLIFLMGYRIKWEKRAQTKSRADDLYAFVDKTAENIRRTAGNFVEAVRNEVRSQPPRPEDAPVYGQTEQPDQWQAEQAKPDAPQDEREGEYTAE